MERQIVYLSLQYGGTTIDSAEQYFQCAKVGMLTFSAKKNMPNIILAHMRTYIRLHRKVDLLSRTEKRHLWLAAVYFRNCLFIIYMYTQRIYVIRYHQKSISNPGTLVNSMRSQTRKYSFLIITRKLTILTSVPNWRDKFLYFLTMWKDGGIFSFGRIFRNLRDF